MLRITSFLQNFCSIFLSVSLVCLVLMYLQTGIAAPILPTGLADLPERDQVEVLGVLGFGTATKILENPYPLGGHQGVSFGVTSEYLNTQDLSTFGNKTSSQREFNYNVITLSKGLFYDIDFMLQFAPYPQKEEFRNFGAQVRWQFYSYKFIPGGLSFIVHRSESNFSGLFQSLTNVFDLVSTFYLEDIALYFGYGGARSNGVFEGGGVNGYKGVTASGRTSEVELYKSHALFGLCLEFDKTFFALSVEKYWNTVYGAKLGYRF